MHNTCVAFRCGWNRRPIHWTSEKLSALSDVIYSVAWLICISNALISMHINDSNATERSSEKTDHGSMCFGHIRDNVHAVRPNRLPQFRFASHHFEFLVDTKASFQTLLRLIYQRI